MVDLSFFPSIAAGLIDSETSIAEDEERGALAPTDGSYLPPHPCDTCSLSYVDDVLFVCR